MVKVSFFFWKFFKNEILPFSLRKFNFVVLDGMFKSFLNLRRLKQGFDVTELLSF